MIFDDDGIARMPSYIRPLKNTEHQYREDRDDIKQNKKKLRDRDDSVKVKSDIRGDTKPPDTDTTEPDKSDNDDVSEDDESRPTRVEIDTKGKNPPRKTRANIEKYTHYANSINVCYDDISNDILTVDAAATMSDISVPTTFEAANTSRYRLRWWEAMQAEIKGLLEHNTWEPVDRSEVPRGKRITKSKWCYTIKYLRDGTIERFKARFVVCGYSQVQGEDYTHAFSATLRSTSFRLLMAVAAGEKLKLEHFDVKNAFTQSEIDAEIYTEPPKGFETKGKYGKIQVLKLIKSLYGTRQASRLWQLKLRNHLINKMGFKNSLSDPCLYVKRDDKGSVMILGVYVDDIILAHKNIKLNDFIEGFCGKGGFNAKHLGKLSWFLGMGIDQHDDYSITINQDLYLKKVMERFVPHKKPETRANPCKPIPFQKLKPAETDLEREKGARLPYLQLIGSLLYLSCMTRPDVAYHMAILCSFMHAPTVEAYSAALDLLLYLHHTSTSHLTFTGSCKPPEGIPVSHHTAVSGNHGMVLYSDASWHKSDKLGHNMFGYVLYLYGGPVSFAAKKLKVVALSSAEAEYAAASYSCKEVVFVRNLCDFLGVKLSHPTVVCVDNQAAIKIAENLGVTAKNKHFQDAIHYFRHLCDHRVVTPVFVTTNHQHADGFTKPLDGQKYKTWRDWLVTLIK
jgi:hypothetical protein